MKHLTPLLIFTLTLPLLASELPQEVPRPAIDSYRHILTTPFVAAPEGISPGWYRKFSISPQTLPDPLLRYQLNVFSLEKETGNAYPLYVAALARYNETLNRAMQGVYRSEAYRALDPTDGEDRQEMRRLEFKAFPVYQHWGREAYAEITPEDEERLYRNLNEVFQLMERASRRTYYDWSDRYEYRGIATLLPQVQEARELARFLASKANWEIRNGRYNDAIRTIRVGLALSDHILEATPPTYLVGMLVGIAIRHIAYEQLFLLAAQLDAPNFYPALMQIQDSSRPWLNALRTEMTSLMAPQYVGADFLETIDRLSSEEAKALLDEVLKTFLFANGGDRWGEFESAVSVWRTGLYVLSYVPAKERLMQKGRTEQEIEALSTHQIIAPFVYEELRRAYDLMQVTLSMPMDESHTAFGNFDEYVMSVQRRFASPVDMIIAMLMPAVSATRSAHHRQTQTLDLLKIIS
ncbi:MAG: hypothetical protein FWE95_10530, partial [Planctomycetaceae bacterium]|nr:hypothetical protein [Planctomycetaceae bacterium]